MRRRAARVAICDEERFSMLDSWIDLIELRRSANGEIAVWANKFCECPSTAKRKWRGWSKTKGIRKPSVVFETVELEAESLGFSIDWNDALPLIATLDWLTAAIIAKQQDYSMPDILSPEVLFLQRSFRRLGDLTIMVEWGYCKHELTISMDRWLRICAGESWDCDKPYLYEAQRFTSNWSFADRKLLVTYDDGGCGWEGSLKDLESISGPIIDGIDIGRLFLAS